MVSSLSEFINSVREFSEMSTKAADPRVSTWLFMGSLKSICIVIATYLVLVYYGLHYIKSRKPFNLKIPVLVYDVSMIIMNAYIVYESLSVAIEDNFQIICQKIDYSTKTSSMKLARAIWLFHVSKVIECLDTFFFIARGRAHLVTWLHIYHHCTMIPLTWMVTKWAAGGEMFNPVVTNSSIHVVMYSYYALAALGPAWRKYLWWKRYLTILQMVQFVYGVVFSYVSTLLDCGLPHWVYFLNVFYQFSLFVLFSNHFYHSYFGSKRKCGLKEPNSKPTLKTTEILKID